MEYKNLSGQSFRAFLKGKNGGNFGDEFGVQSSNPHILIVKGKLLLHWNLLCRRQSTHLRQLPVLERIFLPGRH